LHNNKEVKIFNFGNNDEEIKEFIKNNIYSSNVENKFEIAEGNFDRIYLKWLEKVKPSIAVNWKEEKKNNIYDSDFYLADLLSRDGISLKEGLLIVLQEDHYKLINVMKNSKLFKEDEKYFFKDKQKAYKEFWNIYKRPPLAKYWEEIVNRKDLLVSQDIRERKGSYFTPQIWVELSQKYIENVFGDHWQDKYYVWDCCAGTGNMLVGINRKLENVFASTIDQSDVNAIYDRIDNGARLLKKNVFQFDVLNDDFKRLPEKLKEIIKSKEKRKKLIIYINPPYAEVSSVGVKGKKGVNISKTQEYYKDYLGTAARELFAQFLIKIYYEIDGCKIAEFSTLKSLTGSAFDTFRNFFKAKLLKCFIMPANTFDNVNGKFPIGFKIWNTEDKKKFKTIVSDIYDVRENEVIKLGKKSFSASKKENYINKWISSFKTEGKHKIGFLAGTNGNDFQQNQIVYILNDRNQMANPRGIEINEYNLIECSIYFTIRHCIEHTWINHNDQFLCPNNSWKKDKIFHSDCLVNAIFHGKNH
jgi:hypothetical protein